MGHSVLVCKCQKIESFKAISEHSSKFVCEYKYIEESIKEAKRGEKRGEIPNGCVLVKNWEIIGCGHNRIVQKKDPMQHGVRNCIQNAEKNLKRVGDRNYMNFKGGILYATAIPCYMCAGDAIQFGISKIVVACDFCDSLTSDHAREFLEENGIEVVDLNIKEWRQFLQEFYIRNYC